MKIVADDKIPFLQGVFEPVAEVVYLPGAKTTPADVAGADAVITRTRTKCNAALLDGSRVKFVATATIGFDHFDTAYLERRGIGWTNAPGCNSGSVAQYIASALLNLAVKHHFKLDTMTLGVIGVGNVGRKVAAAGRALGMNVLLNDPPRAEQEGGTGFVGLHEILTCADIVTTHVPLESRGEYATMHLADRSFFGQMKTGAFYINSSRGEVCDGNALKEALKSGKLAGAVLDVWENEPDIDPELLALVDYATPHIAGYSTDGKANGTAMSVNAVSRCFNLPFKEWYPADVPLPPVTDIRGGDSGHFEQDLLKIVNVSYNIADDCGRLRRSPETFEQQRGNYPLRREFPVYAVCGELGGKLRDAVLALGFQYRK
jgi:erythronate-4-phosphate dehydrogenase